MTRRLVTITTPKSNMLRAGSAPTTQRETPVLSFGRLCINNRFDVVIDAFRYVHHRFVQWQLAIVADGPPITNARLNVFRRRWRPASLVLNATSVDEIHDQLARCEAFRERIAKAGHLLAQEPRRTESVYQRWRSALAAPATSAPT